MPLVASWMRTKRSRRATDFPFDILLMVAVVVPIRAAKPAIDRPATVRNSLSFMIYIITFFAIIRKPDRMTLLRRCE